MGWLIGMDEAGYGPNLGPLVVTATVWEVPGVPCSARLWESLADAVSNTPTDDGRLHVADSKAVYTPARGRGALERGALAALSMLTGDCPITFRQLCSLVKPQGDEGDDAMSRGNTEGTEPWFAADDLPLPTDVTRAEALAAAGRWRDCCEASNVRLRAVRSDVVFTPRFNRLVAERGNKASALSHVSLRVLRSVWDPRSSEPTLIIADKHGGRDRYEAVLADALDGAMPLCRREGRDLSEYRVGAADIRFQTRAEEHLPVALASMVSKYVRETAMDLFNGWWTKRLPNLRPTKGYPTDAARFRSEIAPLAARLGIADDILWRSR